MNPRGFACLMYHELERPGRPLCQSGPGYVRYILRETKFRDHMRWLQASGWRGMSVGEALGSSEMRRVAITFDDGCETDLLIAAPILKQTGNGATFYVTAGFLGEPGYLSASQLRELQALGFEIGCHSMTHPYLNDLDDSALRREIVEAKERIEQLIGKPVEHFSCPGGRYDHRAVAFARAAGYRSMANSQGSLNSSSTDPFFLGRIAVLRETSEPSFRSSCQGKGLWKRRLRDSVKYSARSLMGNFLYDRIRALILRDNNVTDGIVR
ncbi:MAG: polysaccharide deacetylase family protein [Candidatus Sulfotelmatobacter sp.]|jgi:peptidoglycan/xylan/chitin deacetylase (PgdA/CDA1 family)